MQAMIGLKYLNNRFRSLGDTRTKKNDTDTIYVFSDVVSHCLYFCPFVVQLPGYCFYSLFFINILYMI